MRGRERPVSRIPERVRDSLHSTIESLIQMDLRYILLRTKGEVPKELGGVEPKQRGLNLKLRA